eukprot:227701-Pelagomonas_calceolata.AAC.1
MHAARLGKRNLSSFLQYAQKLTSTRCAIEIINTHHNSDCMLPETHQTLTSFPLTLRRGRLAAL